MFQVKHHFFLKWTETSGKTDGSMYVWRVLLVSFPDWHVTYCCCFRSGGEFWRGFQGWGKLKETTDLQESVNRTWLGRGVGTRRSFSCQPILQMLFCALLSVSSLRVSERLYVRYCMLSLWGSRSLQQFPPCYWTSFLCSLAETISGINILLLSTKRIVVFYLITWNKGTKVIPLIGCVF